MVAHRHVVIGFQGSGKTTYAAALWHLVDARAKEAPTVLSKGTHRGDYGYLEAIAGAWESGYQVKRSGVGTWLPIAINLTSQAIEGDIELSFVDMSGETFEQIFASREYDARVETMARGCEGLLLFVSADRKIDDATLVAIGMSDPDEMPDEIEDEDEDELLDELSFSGDGATQDATSPKSETDKGVSEPASAEAVQPMEGPTSTVAAKPSDFTPALTPRQVQIVDLLDAFADPPVELKPARIAVIISAWDLVGSGVTPEHWLARTMPLLDQYLKNLPNEVETRIYGVSAQGGRLPKRDKPNEPSDRDALLAEPVASRRIRVVGHNAGAHDLTHPIAWLSGLEP
ncbi:MAG: hypothetical protein EOS41_14380 [Mesorhizobium sp.]|uniref:TRAFAC clade GTPase domain-containing protein n=1 Tax=Mesorhizobium sp. TaxID=1871066 RepID=UPI000FE8DF58|nr:hypothetical protein [Mesorhizobium sp.]RWE24773.1 MAG: hypothetical protein EOS41_14380 [Mesorhizobium sp.]